MPLVLRLNEGLGHTGASLRVKLHDRGPVTRGDAPARLAQQRLANAALQNASRAMEECGHFGDDEELCSRPCKKPAARMNASDSG